MQVNFCVLTLEVEDINHQDFPIFILVAKLLQNTQLHQIIREQGGAYGSNCSVTPNGLMHFTSYRDPNHLKTIHNYKLAVQNIVNSCFTQEDLDSAKISVFKSFDSP